MIKSSTTLSYQDEVILNTGIGEMSENGKLILRRWDLEKELAELDDKSTASDSMPFVATRTFEQLQERYAMAGRMIAIRKELGEIFAIQNRS